MIIAELFPAAHSSVVVYGCVPVDQNNPAGLSRRRRKGSRTFSNKWPAKMNEGAVEGSYRSGRSGRGSRIAQLIDGGLSRPIFVRDPALH